MKLKILMLLFLLPAMGTWAAPDRQITGKLIDKDSKEGVMQATIQLLQPDSTFIGGTVSNEDGLFFVNAPRNGKYLLKISSVGYTTLIKHIEISQEKDLAMGNITMSTDAIMLKGATVVGQAMKVTLREDTFVYNSAAYRTPEGSTIEELVKRLPGAQVDDNGKITINGKEVKKILVDGKEFMTGDTKTALKNLPTSIVDRIKAYDQRSDLSRVTGIDDGEEETVLDFGVKPGMNHGMFTNIDLGVGTKSRYSGRGMGAVFTDKSRFMLFANANNTNDMGFPGGGGYGRWGAGRQGLNATKMIGGNYNFEIKDRIQIDASLRWNHSNGDVHTIQSTQNFVGTGAQASSYGNSIAQNYSRSNSWDGRLRLEWKPDTMTNIMFRPSFTWSTGDGRGLNTSATFNEDPYLYVSSPLSTEALAQLAADSTVVNSSNSTNISYSTDKNLRGMLQYNRRLGNKGRNFTLRVDGNYGKSDSQSLQLNNVRLYLLQTLAGTDSTYMTNRYNTMPTTNYGYRLQATYSEPLWRATFLQLRYSFRYSYSKSDRSTYDFSQVTPGLFDGVVPAYRQWNDYLSLLANPVETYLDSDLSRYSEYKNYINEFEVMFRMIRPKYNFNVGVMVQPQKSNYVQNYQGIHVDTTRTVTNVTPTLDFRYRISKVSNLRINYRGTTSQPSMSQLLDITDDSNPLNISKGNPGLKPSFTNRFRLFYNNYIEKHQRAIMTFVNYSNTRNSISNKVTYNEATGGRTTQPENINGNWNAMGAFMFNTAIDSAGYWNVNTFTNANYNNYAGYLVPAGARESVKNITRSLTLGERLGGGYRNDWLEVNLDGSVNYTHSRNKLQPDNDLDTWQFAYGGSVNVNLPWGMSISSDIHENSRRGYNDAAMNTNELVWNAQLSQGFLKGNALTVSLQFYDILHNQSNFSRTINDVLRSDTQYNSINSYAMLHVIYRLNIFGGQHRQDSDNGPGFGGPGRRHGGGGPGSRGGFGGRRMF